MSSSTASSTPNTTLLNYTATMSLTSTRRAALISRFPPPEDRNIWKVPNKTFDLAAHQSLGTVISTQTPDPITIDLMADMRYPFAASSRCISQVYNSLDLRDNPIASPPMLVAYAMHLLATYYLAHDMYTRESPSDFATTATNSSDIRDLFDATLNAYVPDFMEDIFETLAPFIPDTAPHVTVVPSLAGFCSRSDMYRFPPPMIMLAAHNIMASYPSNTNPTAITQLWLQSNVLRLGTNNLIVNRWLNQAATHTTIHEQQNWFNVLVNRVFTPITTRAIVNRPTFSRIAINPVSLPANQAVNPYIALLGYTSDNLDGIRVLYNAGSSISHSALNGKRRLGDYLVAKSNGAVFRHALHARALPTWNNAASCVFTAVNRQTPVAQPTEPDFRPAATQAADQALLPTRTAIAGLTNHYLNATSDQAPLWLTRPRRTQADPAAGTGNIAANATTPHDHPEYGTFKTFNPDRDHLPHTLYHGYPELVPTAFAGPIQSGIIIETDEISSIMVPLPNVAELNSYTNSQFLSSLVPVRNCVRITTDNAANPIYNRQVYTFRTQPLGLSLGTASLVGLPIFNFRTAPAIPAAGTPLHGFTTMNAVHQLRLGYTHVASQLDSDLNIHEERIHLWSPYRYIRIQSRAQDDIFSSFTPDTTTRSGTEHESRVFMFSSLRNILGCQYKYGEGMFPARTFF
nr:capsid protein [Sarcosphaera coronaria partitivirus]